MKTELYSVSKIFTERLLRIPDYQRGYAWTKKQLKDFWGDIQQLEKGHNHYVGVLTLEDVEKDKYSKWDDDEWIIESKNYEPYYVVDGQQRLTTTVILIQCILEAIGDREINYTKPDEIRKKFIFESKDEGISRSYLFGYEIDNPSYEFLKQKIFCELSDNQPNVQETIYTNNLLMAKEYFKEQLSNLDIHKIEALYTKVTQNLLFNIYSMSDEIDVHVSFETMNNRGKPLSHLELLKNRLIYLSTKVDSDDFEKRKLRDSINECWKTIYHQLGRNKDNPLDDDVFLFNHFILFYGKALNNGDSINYRRFRRGYGAYYQDYLLEDKFTTKSLNSDENEKLTVPELYRYVSSLKSSVEKWYEISNPKGSSLDPNIAKWLEKINRTEIDESLPLIMVSLQKERDQLLLVKFLKSLEKLLFCMLLANRSYRITFSSSVFIEWASSLSNDEISLDKIISQLDDAKEDFAKDLNMHRQISESFKDGGFYRWRGLKYFMYEYEQELKEKSKTYTDKLHWEDMADDIRDHKTIEHIYPQNPRKACWVDKYKHYSGKERSILRHSIGNLVPLSQPKNSSFQNKPFLEKVGNSKTTIGFRYGSFSEIEVSNNKQWTAIEIIKRNVKLLKFMEKRWDIDFGGVEKMIEFVNLGFVLKKEDIVLHNKAIQSTQKTRG
ncbi:DUF262 domain-containing HNH endonuclease family protein [Shewanella sp. AS1]|uniref:DUF262 domain-containing protein n=1 Tax=Shewanella sp. AS1 TaxID=2907626 RepID=UPI001F21E33B|nr:DUF262 domain-containing protein [Shewanella sp. AS1]MCE9679475.1 DUF262 domain-containing HNH endonuclease family protein [Shewanella sp. AS1]